MKIPLSWLRDFVDVPVGADDLAALLSMRGFELAGLEQLAGGDAVLDLEITANRPDCMSVLGIAREVATAYGLPLRLPGPDEGTLATQALAPAESEKLGVEIVDPDLCPRYAAALADVTIGPSPDWLAKRLVAAGVRPINNVVDLSNYVMLEIGHPTHAFDLRRLAGGRLVIRRARDRETVRTLDGEERRLATAMLVIADAERPQAVAGVMGGADSEVGAATRTVALESAWFAPVSVRRTSKALGLKTEASARFERGADIGAPVLALERVAALLHRIGSGRADGRVIDRYPTPRGPIHLVLRRERIARVLGRDVDTADVIRVLEGLRFRVAPEPVGRGADVWRVEVPTARVDVVREIDLIEEIARHVGYDRLPETFPVLVRLEAGLAPRIQRQRLVRKMLQAAGFSEAITFTFIEQAAAEPFASPDVLVPLANPLSEKFAVLRPSMLPGLVDSIGHNRRRERQDVRLFEVGSRFAADTGETRALGMAATGAGDVPHWSVPTRPLDFFDLKGAVERVCDAFGIEPRFEPIARSYLVPGRAALVSAHRDGAAVELGVVGQLAPTLAAARNLPGADALYVAELDLDALARCAAPRDDLRVSPLPRYPSIVRDLSIVVDEALPASRVHGTIRSAAPDTLESVREFDRYQGKGIPEGAVSLSLRLVFRSASRTLTDVEVQQAVAAIVGALTASHGAVLRGDQF